MKTQPRAILAASTLVALCLATPEAIALPMVFTMEVVEVNGTPIVPVTEITANPGDTLTIEFFAEGWAPSLLGAYQVSIDTSTFTSGVRGRLDLARLPCSPTDDPVCFGRLPCDPFGFCACEASLFVDIGASTPCANDTECLHGDCAIPRVCSAATFVSCTTDQQCEGGGGGTCEPVGGGFCQRQDQASFPRSIHAPVRCEPLPLALSAFDFEIAGTPDQGTRRYLGTAIFTLSEDACGDFVVAMDPAPANTAASDTFAHQIEPSEVTATVTIRAIPPGLEAFASGDLGACCDPALPDDDQDGVTNVCDNCDLFNPDQLDCQGNGVGDPCDIASDTGLDVNRNNVIDVCEGVSLPAVSTWGLVVAALLLLTGGKVVFSSASRRASPE